MASTISAGTTSGTAIAIAGDTSGQLQLQTNGTTTAVTITTAQNVGIGTSSPTRNLTVYGTNATIAVQNSTTGATSSDGMLIQQSGNDAYLWNLENSFFSFGTNNTERMRVAADGTVGIGLTSGFGAQIDVSGSTSSNSCYFHNAAGTGVYLVNGNTSFNTISDERNKIIDRPITNALANLNTLRTVYGRYKVEGDEDKSRLFLIAQDVQKVYPEVVDVQENEEKTLGLRYVDLVPVLTAAIQELNAKVDAQATTIATLQARLPAENT